MPIRLPTSTLRAAGQAVRGARSASAVGGITFARGKATLPDLSCKIPFNDKSLTRGTTFSRTTVCAMHTALADLSIPRRLWRPRTLYQRQDHGAAPQEPPPNLCQRPQQRT